MNKFLIVLDGGFKSCCATYPASQLMMFTKDWFNPKLEIEYKIIDITKDYWKSDILADLVHKHLKDKAFPLTYLNGKFIDFGKLPERDDCFKYIENKDFLTETKILKRLNEIKTETK